MNAATKLGDFQALQRAVGKRLAANRSIRRKLPGGGRLKFDRQLPFLCVHRQHPNQVGEGARSLITTEAAYLFTTDDTAEDVEALRNLVAEIWGRMLEHFGVFLLLEVWEQPVSSPSRGASVGWRPAVPKFKLHIPPGDEADATAEALKEALGAIDVGGRRAIVSMHRDLDPFPAGLPPLLNDSEGSLDPKCLPIGIEIDPIYRDRVTGEVYPLVMRALRSQFSKAIRRAIAAYTGSSPKLASDHQALGPTSLVKAARRVDQELADITAAFDFLLQVTPVNLESAWKEFRENDYGRHPELIYRPLPYDPAQLKRRLFSIEVERIEDATLAHLFWEKQVELDRQLSALRDIQTPEFLYSSIQLYGRPDSALLQLAEDVIDRVECNHDAREDRISTDKILAAARDEIDYYHRRDPTFKAHVDVRDDIASGIMVSKNRLLLSNSLSITRSRLVPLLHHEVGTHLLTYFNGESQPFQQLCEGLAGYDELQEGLAVLAEYLVGGLTPSRIRTLAARVLVVQAVCDGASFADAFEMLKNRCGLGTRLAFNMTVRAYRGGGLTKDAIYLRGLRNLLEYVQGGHELELLWVGKIGLQHVSAVQELRRRGIVKAPGVLPRFWQDEQAQRRLQVCRECSVLELLESS